MALKTEARSKLLQRQTFPGGVDNTTLTGNVTLSRKSAQRQRIDPAGNRNVTLYDVDGNDDDGDWFEFTNRADAAETITVLNAAAATICALPRGGWARVSVQSGAWAVESADVVLAEATGTGAGQNVAHGLGIVPGAVQISITELPDAAAETGFDVAEGTHTATNVVVTVTTTVKFVARVRV